MITPLVSEAFKRSTPHAADEAIRIVRDIEDVAAFCHPEIRSVIFMPEISPNLKAAMEEVDTRPLPLSYEEAIPRLGAPIAMRDLCAAREQSWPACIAPPAQEHILLAARAFASVSGKEARSLHLFGFAGDSHARARNGKEYLEASAPHIDDAYQAQMHVTLTRHGDQTLELYPGRHCTHTLNDDKIFMRTRADLAAHKKKMGVIPVPPGAIVLMKGGLNGYAVQAHSGPVAEPGKQRISAVTLG